MIKKLLASVIVFFFYTGIRAQSGPYFVNFLNASNNYYWQSYGLLKQSNSNYLSGGALITGMIAPTNGGLVSLTTNGAIAWQKYYQDFMPGPMVESGTNIYTLFGNGHSGQCVSKHNNTNGSALFAKQYSYSNPTISGQPYGIRIFKEGTNLSIFSVCVYTNGAQVGLVTKIDASGNSVFSKRIDSMKIGDVVQSGANYIIMGQKVAAGVTVANYLLVVDANLTVLWSKQIDFTENLYLYGLYVQNNSIYILGGDYNTRGLVMGFDMSGNLLMHRTYYAPGANYLQSYYLVYRANHLYYVTNFNTAAGEISNVAELSMTGSVIRDRQLDLSANAFYNSIVTNPDTSVYAVGQVETTPSVYSAFHSHFAIDGNLEMCTPDSIGMLDSALTVSLSAAPTFTATNEPVTFTTTVLAASTVSSLSVGNLKTSIDSVSGTNPVCGASCSGDETVYYSGFDTNPTIQWSANTGSQVVQTASGLCPGIYSVTVTDQFGCSASGKDTLKLAGPPAPDLCMVTVDSASTYNYIYWDKTAYPMADSFIVYREVATNNYSRIGAVSMDSLSMFIDTSRHVIPANGDPNISTYRYKLRLRDTCGTYGLLGPFHTSIYFNDLHNGSFTWNTYMVEGMANTPISTFELLRDSNNTGYWKVIGTCAGTSNILNDPQYSTFQNVANWRVQANGLTCTPTMRYANNGLQSTVVKTKSNISNNRTTGAKNLRDKGVVLYPNPFSDKFTITSEEKATIIVYNALGAVVYEAQLTDNKLTIDLSNNAAGVYNVTIKTDNGVTVKKIVKQ